MNRMSNAALILKAILFFCTFAITAFCQAQDVRSTYGKFRQVIDSVKGDTVAEIRGSVRCIFQDSKSNIWFATNGDGVFKYDGKTIVQFTTKHGLPCNFVWSVQEGKDGRVWFRANVGNGKADSTTIWYFEKGKFVVVGVNNVISQKESSNNLDADLVGEYYYNGKEFIKIHLPDTSPLKNKQNSPHFYDIYCTCRDRKGNLWFGTQGAGVCRYDGEKYTWLADEELGDAIRAIFEDRNGAIWIGNNGYGLFRYDGKTLTNITREKKLENPDWEKYPTGKDGTLARVWTITDDNAGNLWIGTVDAGVWMFDGKKMTNYTTRDGLGIDFIWTIYKDKTGNLWFGTDGAGVYTFNGKKFTKFTVIK